MVSIIAGVLFARAANQALWEGILALVAAAMVASLTVHMWRTAKHLKGNIERHLSDTANNHGRGALFGVFVFTLFMITREGMETALLMNVLFRQIQSTPLIIGAIAGILTAAGIAWLWSRYGHRVNLALFFQVTAVFLLVFVFQLLLYGFHELTEANILPYSEPLHWATEPYGPDGRYGRYITYMLVAMPLAWLIYASLRHRRASLTP